MKSSHRFAFLTALCNSKIAESDGIAIALPVYELISLDDNESSCVSGDSSAIMFYNAAKRYVESVDFVEAAWKWRCTFYVIDKCPLLHALYHLLAERIVKKK